MNKKFFGKSAEIITPGSFDMVHHFYTRVQNAQLHPMVSYFLNMSGNRIISRYCHLNPQVYSEDLEEIMNYRPRFFPWGGSDLFQVTTDTGKKQMAIIETNSCPSGQKSMPLLNEHMEQGGYKLLIEETFKKMMPKRGLPKGGLAVIYDKNIMENSGYAAAMADVFNEDVFLVSFYDGDTNPSVKFTDGVMEVRDKEVAPKR